MSETPTDRETVERIIAKQPMLTSLPPQENDVAKTLRALVAERDALAARIEELEAKLVKVEEDVAKWQHAFSSQSRKLQAVLHIEGVKAALAELKGQNDE